MSTKKITALTELAAAAAATDMIPVVDVSDTTDAASGTTKKITALNIGKGVGIGLGNTTTEPLKIDTSNMRIGIGTGTPQTLVEMKGVAGSPSILTMSTAEATVVDGDKLGQINFQAPQEGSGTDAILVGASIHAEADDTFATDNNETELVFATAASEAATEKVRITSDGKLGVGTPTPAYMMELYNPDTGNAEFSAMRLTNYDYGSGETAQSVTLIGGVKNAGGGVSSCGKITFGKDSDYSDAANRDGNIQFITNRSNTETEAVRISSDGKVGIGAATPLGILHTANATATNVMERFANSTGGPILQFTKSRGTSVGATTIVQDGDTLGTVTFRGADGNSIATGAFIDAQVAGTPGDGDMPACLRFCTTPDGSETGTEKVRIDSTGNVLIGGTATPTSSVGNLCLFNGTIPAASVTDGVVLYAQDVSTSELKVRDEAGNVSTLSPHNFDLLGDRSEDMAWSYSSKNVFVGKEIAVDMTQVIRALEKLTGEEYIKIRDIADSEKLDWATEEKRKEAEQKKQIDAYKARKAESDAYPTSSSTKAEVKAYLDKSGIEYEDATKDKLFEKVAEKEEFTETEPAAYSKKSKPSWIK